MDNGKLRVLLNTGKTSDSVKGNWSTLSFSRRSQHHGVIIVVIILIIIITICSLIFLKCREFYSGPEIGIDVGMRLVLSSKAPSLKNLFPVP
jgi:hypothetical protein